jgi:hypothetical protein
MSVTGMDIYCLLKDKCKNLVAHLIGIDDSIDITDIAQLVVFIQSVNEDLR